MADAAGAAGEMENNNRLRMKAPHRCFITVSVDLHNTHNLHRPTTHTMYEGKTLSIQAIGLNGHSMSNQILSNH